MGLTASWKVEVDGRDITPRLVDRLISLEVRDGKNAREDSASITLQDDPPVDWPEHGRSIQIWMGYGDDLADMGTYQVAVPRSSGPPAQLVVQCNPQPPPTRGGAGGDKPTLGKDTFSFEDTGLNLDKHVNRIAKDLGLEWSVDASVAHLPVTQVQANETHGGYLDRLAQELGLTVRIRNGRLIVADRHSRSAASSGRTIQPITLTRADIESWDGALVQRAITRQVRARWLSPSDGKSGAVSTGSGRPARTLGTVYPDQVTAERAVRAALRRGQADAADLKLTLKGHPRYASHVPLDISEALRPGIDGSYQIVEAHHRIDGSGGYRTEVTCEQAL